jgi:hypothetical protein
MSSMSKKPSGSGRLIRPTAAEQRHVMDLWRLADSGMEGPRSSVVPDPPDDPVAYKLLEAADAAMERGDWRRGVNILKLVVRDYRQSREAALARQAIDELAARRGR